MLNHGNIHNGVVGKFAGIQCRLFFRLNALPLSISFINRSASSFKGVMMFLWWGDNQG